METLEIREETKLALSHLQFAIDNIILNNQHIVKLLEYKNMYIRICIVCTH